MTAKEIIQLIPPELFGFLAEETQVDYQVKKLTGEAMFKPSCSRCRIAGV